MNLPLPGLIVFRTEIPATNNISMSDKSKKGKLVAAISGGVDSCVAAMLAAEAGWKLIGVNLHLNQILSSSESGGSVTDESAAAKAVAEHLGIPFKVLDLSEEFNHQILKRSWREYRNGRTPNPCAVCNRLIKFGKLLDYGRSLGAEGIVTGHHARLENVNGSPALKRGNDPNKDQTYFLFNLTPRQLACIHFPLGGMTKQEVRELAKKYDLPSADEPESQDTCFQAPGENFAEALRMRFRGHTRKGNFIDTSGKILDPHAGIHNYTIGQRKGLRIALGKPAYVSSIDPVTGNVELTVDENDLLRPELVAERVNWQQPQYAGTPFEALVQIRYRSRPVKGKVFPVNNGKSVRIEFEFPLRAITPGQAAVFYDNDMLIGGGWIKHQRLPLD